MKIRYTLLFLLIGLDVFSQTEITATTFENDPLGVKEYTLSNGLKVYLSENHDKPQVFGMITVKAGGKNDPIHATGMAHYLEHMLFKGTETMGTTDFGKEKVHLDRIVELYEELGKTTDEEKRLDIQKQINDEALKAGEYAIPNEMDRMLSEIGSTDINAFTTEDFTAYHNTFPSNQIEKWLSIYDSRFENPVFRLFQSELETVYEEKNRSADDPFSALIELFFKKFYKHHPYGQQPLIGFTEHLKNPSLSSMYEYFENYYVANNMALVLAGDFKSEEIIVKIDQYFGDWRTGEIPVFKEYAEEPFKGAEAHEEKMTPIKVGLRGYRTPKNGHKDQLALRLTNNLLSNEEASGLLDDLVSRGDVMYVGMIPINYNDHGASILLYVPKIIGQSFEKAELLIDAELEKVRTGNFDDGFFEAARVSLQKEIEMTLEDNESRVMLIGEAFAQNVEWQNYLNNLKQIEDLTKEDIVAVMNKYYNDNFMILYSKHGKPDKDRLEKPKFKPVVSKNETKSEFYNQWSKIPSTQVQSKFVDFDKDILSAKVAENVHLNVVQNPYNNWFNLDVSWGTGKYYDSLLNYAPQYLSKVGTPELEAAEISRKLFELGSTFYFSTEEEKITLHIEGHDSKMKETLVILDDFLKNFEADDDVIQSVKQDLKGERKIANEEPMTILRALQEYVVLGSEAPTQRELSSKEVGKVKGLEMKESIQSALNYAVNISYSGRLPKEEVTAIIQSNFSFSGDLKPKQPLVNLKKKPLNEPTVHFIDEKEAVQTQLMFFSEGEVTDPKTYAIMDAFNAYFGGNMSSLVFQEIREFRSLAYSTFARYQRADQRNQTDVFFAYIGCQGDKTPEALEAIFDLIKNMPEKKERETAILSSLKNEAKSARPGFRSLATTVEEWKQLGYTSDPNEQKLEVYETITFEDIVSFYENYVKTKKLTLVVVGSKKNFDVASLEKYGPVQTINKKKVLKK